MYKEYLEYEDIEDNLVVIKINRSYYKGISPRELYEYTRGYWKRKISSVSQADYALAVVFGEVVEVYKIDYWVQASEADNIIRVYDPKRYSDRIAFYGKVADAEVKNKYVGKSVAHLYKFGEASPVKLLLRNRSLSN